MRERRKGTVCGEDALHAIRNAYPENMVTDDVLYGEKSYYNEIREEIRRALSAVKGADLLYDRPPEGRPHWNESSDPEEDPPDWEEPASSYDLLFLALRGKQFEFEGELYEEDVPEDTDDPVPVMVPTVGRIGCAVGISIIAPFAAIRFTEIETAESGSGTIPDIFPMMFDLEGHALDMEAHYEYLYGEEGINALRNLRMKITQILQTFNVRVLSDRELNARIPGLKSEPQRDFMRKKRTVTVEDALFFQAIG